MQDVLENEFSKQVTSNHWYKNSDDDTVYLKEKDAKKAFEEKYMKDFSEKNMNILSLICNVAEKHLCMKFTRGTGMGWGQPPWDQEVTKFILANLDFIKDLINSNIMPPYDIQMDENILTVNNMKLQPGFAIEITCEGSTGGISSRKTAQRQYDKLRYKKWIESNSDLISRTFREEDGSDWQPLTPTLNKSDLLNSYAFYWDNCTAKRQSKENLLKFFYTIVDHCKKLELEFK